VNYLSVCSGIEAATVAWHDMGWKPVGFSEIEKFPSQLLQHHYPHVTNYGDMTKFKEWKLNDTVGLLVGGTPCQSFSVAGLRKGLEDPRGNLMLTYLGIADHFKPKWLLWENVPGVLSSNGGEDFACFLKGLAELGYGFAYRVLDAQHFGVPQRRRRVFVVGCLGDWRSAAKVLFESESLQGDITPSREKREKVTGYVESSFGQYREDSIGGTLKASGGVLSGGSETFLAETVGTLDTDCGCSKLSHQSAVSGHLLPIAYNITFCDANGTRKDRPDGGLYVNKTDTSNTLTIAGVGTNAVHNMRVRRLTEIECERLQGFPDNYTNIKDNCPSGARYKALGNSMAVPVMKWIGQRINELS
jgi:DNA (cytosine-5)-methyltransferase 1